MTKQTYLKSVDILLDAYNNGTLFRGDCDKCAVGSLLGTSIWGADFCSGKDFDLILTEEEISKGVRYRVGYEELHNMNITTASEIRKYLDTLYSSNGYTRNELATIERVFEKTEGDKIDGLRAVLTVMAEMVEEKVDNEASQTRLETIYKSKYEHAN